MSAPADAFRRVFCVGDTADGSLWIRAEYSATNPPREGQARLSICGVVGPRRDGDCRGSAGQCRDAIGDVYLYRDGWTPALAQRLGEIWDRWHLNDMRAGSPAQEHYLRNIAEPWQRGGAEDHYTWAHSVLGEAELQPDPGHERDGKPYSYGSAWLYEEIPAEVLDELRAMPEAPDPCPWQNL